VCVNNR